jgi:uncharacterized linocin/CFP29 family protein
MDPALAQLGWTDEQWNRICTTVTEEAQKARVAAQILPVIGPEDSSTIAIPRLAFGTEPPPLGPWPALERPFVDSNPNLNLTTISAFVPLRGHEVADPNLAAALTMFRRAANYVARLEDALVFNGRSGVTDPPPIAIPGPAVAGIPDIYKLATDGVAEPGILNGAENIVPLPQAPTGQQLVTGIVEAITLLENEGQLPPFACVLGTDLFVLAHTPDPDSYVMPRDRILPLIQGPLVRTSTAFPRWGALIALNGNPIELVVASDIGVQYLQTTVEPRYVFRVVERVALRIKEPSAIAVFITEDP